MTIWFGLLGIIIVSEKSGYIENLKNRFNGYVNDEEGQICIEIIETNFKPEITKNGNNYFWVTMFSGNIYLYVDNKTWKGKAFICEETPVRYDAIDSMLTMLAAHFLPLFCSILAHGCCVNINGKGICFMGDSGAGKSTIAKIFSSEYCITAEDMLIFECYPNKLIGRPTAVGQKHFWVPSQNSVNITSIVFVEEGNWGVVQDNNKKVIFDSLLHNQFYKARPLEYDFMDAMRLSVGRIISTTNFYRMRWKAERFYTKDRAYITNVKNMLISLLENSNTIESCDDNSNSLELNKFIRFRKDSEKERYEIWDTSVHRLYGANANITQIIESIIANEQASMDSVFASCQNTLPAESVNEIKNDLIKYNIVKRKVDKK